LIVIPSFFWILNFGFWIFFSGLHLMNDILLDTDERVAAALETLISHSLPAASASA